MDFRRRLPAAAKKVPSEPISTPFQPHNGSPSPKKLKIVVLARNLGSLPKFCVLLISTMTGPVQGTRVWQCSFIVLRHLLIIM